MPSGCRDLEDMDMVDFYMYRYWRRISFLDLEGQVDGAIDGSTEPVQADPVMARIQETENTDKLTNKLAVAPHIDVCFGRGGSRRCAFGNFERSLPRQSRRGWRYLSLSIIIAGQLWCSSFTCLPIRCTSCSCPGCIVASPFLVLLSYLWLCSRVGGRHDSALPEQVKWRVR